MTMPNILTILRVLLIPVFVSLLAYGRFRTALGVLLFVGISDSLDGYLARRYGTTSALGSILDPVADKLVLDTSYIALAVMGYLPRWLMTLVIGRDAFMLLGLFYLLATDRDATVTPVFWGRATTFTQISYVVLVLISESIVRVPLLWVAMWLTVAFTSVSGVYYLYVGGRTFLSPKGGHETL